MRPILAVLTGAVVDIVASVMAGFPIAIIAMLRLDLGRMTPEQQVPAITAAMQTDPLLYSLGLLMGCLASILGGYVAATIARRSEVLVGALSAVLCVLMGVRSVIDGTSPIPLGQHLIFFGLSPALGALGGYLRLRQTASASAPPPIPAA